MTRLELGEGAVGVAVLDPPCEVVVRPARLVPPRELFAEARLSEPGLHQELFDDPEKACSSAEFFLACNIGSSVTKKPFFSIE